jgi:hypothetical protein
MNSENNFPRLQNVPARPLMLVSGSRAIVATAVVIGRPRAAEMLPLEGTVRKVARRGFSQSQGCRQF